MSHVETLKKEGPLEGIRIIMDENIEEIQELIDLHRAVLKEEMKSYITVLDSGGEENRLRQMERNIEQHIYSIGVLKIQFFLEHNKKRASQD